MVTIPIAKAKFIAGLPIKILPSLFAVLASLLASAQVKFDNAIIPPGNGAPKSMAVGDFDGNGREDVVVNIMPLSKMKVFYTTSPTNQPVKEILLPSGFTSAAFMMVGDLNKDGKDDIVSIHEWNTNMLVLLSTGTGFNITAIPLSVSAQTTRGQIIDFDKDGILDIIVVSPFKPIYFYKGADQTIDLRDPRDLRDITYSYNFS